MGQARKHTQFLIVALEVIEGNNAVALLHHEYELLIQGQLKECSYLIGYLDILLTSPRRY